MTVEEWLGEDNKLGIDIWKKKYCYDDETFDQWLDRISDGNEELRQLIVEKKFLFGGRTLTNYNTNKNASTSNCYSSGYAPDSVEGIMELSKNMALTYKSQGGQGVSLSKIRPKGAKISGGYYTSDGIIPFMEIFNTTTASISQGGSRKGALMMSIDAWHKEIEDFITIKSQEGKIEKANLSVEIDDEFMNCVKNDYQNGTKTSIHRNFIYETGNIEYDITPIEIYEKICDNAYDWGEPGFIFTNKFRNYNLMELDKEYEIITGNPCGEQPLPKNGACNLGSLNLSEFVSNPYTKQSKFDFKEFERSISIAIEALDNVVDYGMEHHALKEQREMSKNYRNIGLGIMGLSSMLVKLGITYGKDSFDILDKIFKCMFKTSVISSAVIAKKKGTFPKYSEKIFDSEIIKKHFSDKEIKWLEHLGLRNCSLLSIAPSGSIATMLNVSTGCEPFFRLFYKRKTESLHKDEVVYYDVHIKEIKEYQSINKNKDIPNYFVSSENIDPFDRIELQGIIQNHIDTAISSTVNLKNDIIKDSLYSLFIFAWEHGLKGITIYRDGCKRSGILTTSENKKEDIKSNIIPRGMIIKADDNCVGRKRTLQTGCGTLHVEAFFDPTNGELLETYFSKGSTGGCAQFMVGLSRMISLSARSGVDINSIIDQLNSSGSCPSYAVRSATKHDTSKGSCCPVAIGNALKDMHNEIQNELSDDFEEDETEENYNDIHITEHNGDKCPECGEPLIFEGGCVTCRSCGWTKCE